MNILITGVGGPTPRSFAIALKKYGSFQNLRLIGTDINKYSIGLYQNELFDKAYIISPANKPHDYWRDINKIVEAEKIDLAIILPEVEVLEWSKEKMNGVLPCKSLIPDYAIAKVLINKADMTNLLVETGMVPDSISFDRSIVPYEELGNKLKYPFWVRSSAGTSGLGSLLVDTDLALKNWIQINPKVNQFIASTYLPGRNLACKLLYFKGNLVRTACGERVHYIMSKVAPSGITGNTSFGRLLNEPNLVSKAVAALDHLFKRTNAEKHGFFTVDFKESENGTAYITEINVRHVAFTQCFAAAGANFPSDTIRLLMEDWSFEPAYKNYEFEEGTIFLRDVDSLPVLMNEKDLL